MCHSSGMVGTDDHPKMVSGEVMVIVQKCFCHQKKQKETMVKLQLFVGLG